MQSEVDAGRSTEREPLTRARILRCALALIDAEGFEAVSMRRLAGELGVSPMSLYNHVPNKDAVLEGICEALLGEIDLSVIEKHDQWGDALKAGFKSYRDVLLRHPNAVMLMETKPLITEDAMVPIEASFALLREAGFSAEEAVDAHCALLGLTMGHVVWQISNPMNNPEHMSAIGARNMALAPERFPKLLESMPYMMNVDYDRAFDFALDALLRGFEQKLGARTEERF